MLVLLLLLLRGYPRSHRCLLSSIQYMLPSSLTKPADAVVMYRYRYVSKSLSLKHFVFSFSFLSLSSFVRSFVRCWKQSKATLDLLDSTPFLSLRPRREKKQMKEKAMPSENLRYLTLGTKKWIQSNLPTFFTLTLTLTYLHVSTHPSHPPRTYFPPHSAAFLNPDR